MFIRISLRVPIYDSTQFTSDLFKHSSQQIPFGIPFITVQDTRVCKLHADCVVRIVDTCFTEAWTPVSPRLQVEVFTGRGEYKVHNKTRNIAIIT